MNNEVGPPTPQGPPAALRVLARVEPEWVRGETPPGLGAASPSHEQRPRATSTSLASDRVIAGGRGDTRRSPNGRQDRVRRRVLRPGSRVRLRLARRQDTACPVVLRTLHRTGRRRGRALHAPGCPPRAASRRIRRTPLDGAHPVPPGLRADRTSDARRTAMDSRRWRVGRAISGTASGGRRAGRTPCPWPDGCAGAGLPARRPTRAARAIPRAPRAGGDALHVPWRAPITIQQVPRRTQRGRPAAQPRRPPSRDGARTVLESDRAAARAPHSSTVTGIGGDRNSRCPVPTLPCIRRNSRVVEPGAIPRSRPVNAPGPSCRNCTIPSSADSTST